MSDTGSNPDVSTNIPANLTVIVTGGARGLGRAMTLSLLRNGVRVAAADLAESSEAMTELQGLIDAAGLGAQFLPIACDVTRWDDCSTAVRTVATHFGGLHGIVNNAGIGMQEIGNVLVGARRKFYEVEARAWAHSINVNVNGPFMMAKAAAPTLVAQRWGRIVNIVTSTYTMMMDGFSPYGPSKAALEAATVIWSKDLAGTGVTVNALLPGGAANTRMIPASEPVDRSRLVQPEAMMAPIAWLMSGRSEGVTGKRIIASEWTSQRLAATPAADVGSPAGW